MPAVFLARVTHAAAAVTPSGAPERRGEAASSQVFLFLG